MANASECVILSTLFLDSKNENKNSPHKTQAAKTQLRTQMDRTCRSSRGCLQWTGGPVWIFFFIRI